MTIALKIEVPIACFRQSHAREYLETYPVPPPSTVYGMLLSLVGEMDRYEHCGTRLAIALLSEPQKSRVVRTFHRYKTRNIHDPSNIRPDYQELLTDIQLIVKVDQGTDRAKPTLVERLRQAFTEPASIDRFGGLSLGESRDLVNAVTLITNLDGESIRWLVQDEQGSLRLPYWVDHVGSKGTRWLRYLIQKVDSYQLPDSAWTAIQAS
ncbi:type I-MYXAN CRISPR-associated protein Cas5/Cmx5/DevS [Leptolyngbya sp. FACHB-671]|uniref:type I-MYXAN CRISPR-associated protein Cas5/Cmx5/DevS n=1 Tax=Leptolyngbya sp. FACHB-671 TaxID=2692812 RepID=UPI001683E2F7|nr:type I-MYXAN CRISPR-associated protein Cas5/Cmx5/DevS [Leptolyngbya sp. FACHB-671]MBD2069539.1 type I-MYXAN CRISPR-associated protein Cas5/Cmx5/DevS [Leptolyngbya sp. FACHB-671]